MSVRRFQQVIGCQHQESCLCLRLSGQRQVHCHLVAVEVGVECGAYQRVQLQRTALYQNRLECLNSQTVQRGRTVQQNRMVVDDIFQCVPNLSGSTVYHFPCALDVGDDLGIYQPLQHKGLEQLQRHFLRQTALVHFQARTDNDNGTAGIVYTLTQQVLTEASLLTFQHIRQGLQRTVIRAGDRSAMTAVIDKGIHCLLQHTLFVADDDVRRIQFQHPLQAVVPVDDTAIQVVQIGSRIAAAVQHDHRTQIRRNNRNHSEDHPLRTVAGLAECLDDFQTLQELHTLLSGGQTVQLHLQLCRQFIQIDLLQQLENCLCAHLGNKVVVIFFTIFEVLLLREELLLDQIGLALLAHIQYDVLGEVEHFFQMLLRDLQHLSDTGRRPLEIPDMRNRRSQFDVTHSLTAHLGTCDFYAAAVADLALEPDLLELSAVALPVLCRSEDAFAEKAVTLRLLCPVVDGFRTFYCAVRPLTNPLRRSKTNFDGFKSIKFQTVTSHYNL